MNGRRAISLVARREIRERLRSRVFLYSTLLMLVVVGAASALPTFINTTKTYHVAVVASAPPGLDAALQRAAKPFDARVKTTDDGAPRGIPGEGQVVAARQYQGG